jgi:N-acetylneuraminic acid mutarotase
MQDANVYNTKRWMQRFVPLLSALLLLPLYQETEARSWNEIAPMNVPRTLFGSAVLDGKIYAIGGRSTAALGSITRTVEVYDPSTDTWSFRADFPGSGDGTRACVVDGTLYAFGLRAEEVYAYDPGNDSWIQKAAMPGDDRWSPSIAVLDGKIYLMGGLTETGGSFLTIANVLVYDTAADTWSEKTRMQVPSAAHEAEVVDGIIYLFGIGDLPVYAYDSATEAWSQQADMPIDRLRPATVTVDGLVYVLGGEPCEAPECLDVVQTYDPQTDRWASAGSTGLRVGRADLEAIYLEGRIYALGGNVGSRNIGVPNAEALVLSHPLVQKASDVFHLRAGSNEAQSLAVELQIILPNDTTIPNLALDLTALGQDQPVALTHTGEGKFTGQASIVPPAQKGLYQIPVRIDGSDSGVLYWLDLAVLPGEDLSIVGPQPLWSLDFNSRVIPTPSSFAGRDALALEGSGSWRLTLLPDAPLNLFGYEALHFYFHPAVYTLDEGDAPRLQLGRSNLLDLVDLDLNEWQRVVMPVTDLGVPEGIPLQQLQFAGNLEGTFYLSDVRLVVQELPDPGPTAVLESWQSNTPAAFALDQNYPNPFNSGTVIGFALPQAGPVELAIYNLAGQQVATLAQGVRAAGQYQLHWDGRDMAGRDLASGLYFYRLQTEGQLQTRKLLLLR